MDHLAVQTWLKSQYFASATERVYSIHSRSRTGHGTRPTKEGLDAGEERGCHGDPV